MGEGCGPCCCCSSQVSCRIIGALQIFGAIYSLTLRIYDITFLQQSTEGQGEYSSSHDLVLLVAIIFIIIFAFISLFLGILLILGANGDVRKCKIWLYSTIVILILDIIVTLGVLGTDHPTYSILVLIEMYFLWVVDSYIEELKISKDGRINTF